MGITDAKLCRCGHVQLLTQRFKMIANIKICNKDLGNKYSLKERVKQIKTVPKRTTRPACAILIEVTGAIQQQWLVCSASTRHLPTVCRTWHGGSSVTDFYEQITQAPATKSPYDQPIYWILMSDSPVHAILHSCDRASVFSFAECAMGPKKSASDRILLQRSSWKLLKAVKYPVWSGRS